MEIFEKIFQQLWTAAAEKRKPSIENTARLEDFQTYLETFANLVQGPEVKARPSILQVLASRDQVGHHGDSILLPEAISFFQDKKLNLEAYLLLVLLASAARACGLKQMAKVSPLMARRQFLTQMPRVNRYLDQEYPAFENFQKNFFQNLKQEVSRRFNLTPPGFASWCEHYCRRDEGQQSNPMDPSKDNEKIPLYLWISTPCLELPGLSTQADQGAGPERVGGGENKPTHEEKKTYSSPVEKVDLEKEQANPVTHSFEKLETADEYNGGRRIDSGDDQLEEHQKALDELNLNKVTTGGEAAQSIYQADGISLFDFQGTASPSEEVSRAFLYPEWQAKKSVYLPQHCRIFESHFQAGSRRPEEKENFRQRHAAEIQLWQRRIESLLNAPLWMNRQKEGDDLDYDEFVREFSCLKARQNIDARWYLRRRQRLQDVAVSILFDQSLSADSWVKNHCVLDVIRDSVGMAGLLFEEILPQVSVAGTWSSTRHRCRFQIYKDFSQSWEGYFDALPEIQAQGYTRLGPAIRHTSERLRALPQRKKLLLLLTDGKPTDVDGYEGIHGIQDVKVACQEAETLGIVPYALTIDQSSKRHFPKMFKQYSLLNDPKDFSKEVYRILLKLIYSR